MSPIASQLGALGKGDPTTRSNPPPVPPHLPKYLSTWYPGPLDNPLQQDWLALVPTPQPKNQRVSSKVTRLKEEYELRVGGGHTSILWLGLLALGSGESFPGFLSQPGHFLPPPPLTKAASLYNRFPLLFYIKTNTIKNTPHSRFFTSTKSKHREMLPRKYSLETKRQIYSKVNIPFYASPKTLREVPLSVLESAKPGRTATVPASLLYPTSAEGYAKPL